MDYYLDTEFDGFGGEILSLALVREDGEEFYWASYRAATPVNDPWVQENVIPIIDVEGARVTHTGPIARALQYAVGAVDNVHVIADWPDDIAYFCQAMITEPGCRIDTPPLTFEILRIDAYPTELEGAVQHNALWDARALKHAVHIAKEG